MTSARHVARRRHAFLAVCLIVWIGELVATHIPVARLPHIRASDKLLHAIAYFVLAGAFWMTLWVYGVGRTKRLACVFFAMLAYAALDEVTQPLVGRSDSVGDWLADVAGSAAALIILELLVLVRARMSRTPPRR